MPDKKIKSETEKALEFVKSYAPEFAIVLTAIIPDAGTTTQTFLPKEIDKCEKWINKHQGKRNIYFTVNPANKPLIKKAKKVDIAALAWLHVDIDPITGKNLTTERARILKLVKEYKPPPTLVIDSGGGYQAFWKLDAVVPVDKNIPELEAYNKQLEIMFKADSCHNIDRIMRLPGTINIPNKVKIAKGRKEALAKIMWFNDVVYPLSTFSKAASVGPAPDTTVELGNVPDDVDLDELGISDSLKGLIRTGVDPHKADKYKSRSEAVFAVATSLVRHGSKDDIIAAILKNRDFKISESCLEHKRPEYYIGRQIQRAKEAVIAPELAELNELHAVVMENGKTRIITEKIDPMHKRLVITRSTFDDFRNFYSNRTMIIGHTEKGPITVKLGKWWLDHARRKQYSNITFAPGMETPGEYNLWKGFAYESIPGDWELLKEHILKNICSGDDDHYAYLFNWMARTVQFPQYPGEVAVVLRGKRGTGKGVFAKNFGKLMGQHFLHISHAKHLTGSFNAHLRDTVILFADEAFWAGDKQGESVLKMLVTEESITVEAKGVDAVSCQNYIHLIMSSNHDWVVPAGNEERRFFVLDVNDERMQDIEFFGKILEQLKNGGREAFLYDLLNQDLQNFEVRKVPQTEALRQQKVRSMEPQEKWWYDILMDGRLMDAHSSWEGIVQCSLLHEAYVQHVGKTGISHRSSQTELGMFLKKILPITFPKKFNKWIEIVTGYDDHNKPIRVRRKPWFYRFPDIGTCRKKFNAYTHSLHPWPEVNDDDEDDF